VLGAVPKAAAKKLEKKGHEVSIGEFPMAGVPVDAGANFMPHAIRMHIQCNM
jgi:hypothetical protein